jgi:ABC-2 type transport system permease protein
MTTATSSTPTTAPIAARTVSTPRVRFRDTLASEWTKLTSLRSTWICVALGILLALGFTALRSAAIGNTWEAHRQDMYANFNPVTWPLDGTLLSTIALVVIGVSVAAAEYTSGMIHLTLAATPRRGQVLAAKATVVAGVTIATGLISVLGMFVVSQFIYESAGMPTASLTNPDTVRVLAAMSVLAAVFPLMGVAAGVLLRSTAGAITTVLALSFVPEILGGLLPPWWQEHVMSLLPSKAIAAAAVGHIAPQPAYHASAIAAVLVVGWLAAALGAAYVVLKRRDA